MKTLKTKLNLGSGNDYKEGWLNVDRNKDYKHDFLFDMSDKKPMPFHNNTFKYILMSGVLEHINNQEYIMIELYRILKNNGILDIRVPNFSSCQALTHPEHIKAYCFNSFKYFEKNSSEHTPHNNYFIVMEKRIIFEYNIFPLINIFLTWIFNINDSTRSLYTTTFLSYLFPLSGLSIKLKKHD